MCEFYPVTKQTTLPWIRRNSSVPNNLRVVLTNRWVTKFYLKRAQGKRLTGNPN